MSDIDYLAPDFDPASVTVARLRNILVTENINYPSGAKKAELIEIFNTKVLPKANRLRNARSKVTRTTRGITDVPSSAASTVDDEDEAQDKVPEETPSVSTRRSTRRSTRQSTAEVSDATNEEPPPSTKTPGRRKTTKVVPTIEEPEEEEPPAPAPEPVFNPQPAKKGRASIAPTLKKEDSEPEAWRQRGLGSPFSSDNPFQSASSPPAPIARDQSSDRRKTTSVLPSAKKNEPSTSSRRKTEIHGTSRKSDGVAKSTTTVDLPVAKLPKREEPEAGEEFTPDEQLQLVRERAAAGEIDILPPRRTRPKQTGAIKNASLALVLATAMGFGGLWRQEKIEVGYCGIGRPTTQIAGVELPDWAMSLQPQCEPCPQHAYCSEKMRTECEPDFVLTPHPLSLWGAVPLPPTCEPDGEKAKRVKSVADRAVEELRDRNAKWECGELVDDKGKHLPSPAIDEDSLKKSMATKRRKGMSQEEFEELWKGAIGEVLGREEVTSDGDGPQQLLRSTSLAKIPLSCAVRRSIRLTLARYFWQLVLILFAAAGAGYGRKTITSGRETEVRAKELASMALDRLATQASLHAQDRHGFPEAGISMTQLRDDVLRSEFSAKRRQQLWEKVQKKVEGNANVRSMVKEDRSGNVSRVWEWVGAVQFIEDGGSARRENKRISFGPASSPFASPDGEGKEMEVRKWDEGRPVY